MVAAPQNLSRTVPLRGRAVRGMTILEIMVVLAIIGGALFIVRSGFRLITKADLVEDSTELNALLARTSLLAVEHAQLARVVLDLDTQTYVTEVCEGPLQVQRNEDARKKKEDLERAKQKGKQALSSQRLDGSEFSMDPEDQARRLVALSGEHVEDHKCMPATDNFTGDVTGKGFIRQLRAKKGIKFKDVYVAHKDGPTTKGQVAIYFWPNGTSEKAVIEVTDGSEVFSILVYGLTGKVELKDGALKNIDDHMLKNVMGDKDLRKHEDER